MTRTAWLSAALTFLALGCADLGTLSPQPDPGPGDDDDDLGAGADAAPEPDPEPVDDGRVKDGLAAVWKFKEATGVTIRDESGVGLPLDLQITDPVAAQWLPTGGILVTAPTIISAVGAPTKIMTACQASRELTLEAWVRPDPIQQDGPARILTYSIDPANRNFMLGQQIQNYRGRVRTAETNANGEPGTLTTGDPIAGPLQHVVFTYNVTQATVYVDAVNKGTQTLGGNFDNWDANYQLAIANEITLDRPWTGEIQLAAVYCKRLSQAEIQQNMTAGY